MRENRRVLMTKKLLKESVLELMDQKPLNKITIKEICENADVNRTTFYKYYGDQYALVKDAEDELLAKTSEFLKSLSSDAVKTKMLEEFLTYVKNNGDTFRILLDIDSGSNFKYRMMKLAMERVMVDNYELGIEEDDKKYVYCLIIMGGINTIAMWIDSDYDKPIKDVAQLMYSFVLFGLKGIEKEK
ncbi:hypothetical protein IMSAG049_01013 [Clostridiales bacterium]|nr:hypothetical protein IMSAG049_01013 [Clostridiales bacterium]